MPRPSPFHPRTSELCRSLRYKEWRGYHAVCSYDSNLEREYYAFRHAAGLLDATPLCKYLVEGADAGRYLSYLTARAVHGLRPGRMVYSTWCDDHGKLIDDGTVACLEPDRYRVTTGNHFRRHLEWHSRGFDVSISDRSDALAALAIQGPTSRAVLEEATGEDLSRLRFFRIRDTQIGGARTQVSRTGYTGDLGYEIWLEADDALAVWDALMLAGGDYGLRPAGLDALDVTRIEAGFVLQDVDYFSAPRCAIESRKSSPYEAGLGWTVELDRGPFLGQAALRSEQQRGAVWSLVGVEIDWEELERLYDRHRLPPALPVHACRDALPLYAGGKQIGQATSSVWSPTLKKYIALATIDARFAPHGTPVQIEHTVEYARERVAARVVPRPFFDPPRKKSTKTRSRTR